MAPRGSGADSRGFVFAATGAKYNVLARRAARTLRLVMPQAAVDLFTDTPEVQDPVFDRIHMLGHSFFRPKMQAMRESRFDRTVMLDVDLVILTGITELFDVLDHYDIAGCHGASRARDMFPAEPDVPRCVPLINSGVLAIRKSAATHGFLQTWEQALRDSGHRYDQPSLRRLLYLSDLKVLALGHEYNVKWLPSLGAWGPILGAPRILHVSDLHQRPPGDPAAPITVSEALGPARARQMARLIAEDWTIGEAERQRAAPVVGPAPGAETAPAMPGRSRSPVALLRRKTRTALRLVRDRLRGR